MPTPDPPSSPSPRRGREHRPGRADLIASLALLVLLAVALVYVAQGDAPDDRVPAAIGMGASELPGHHDSSGAGDAAELPHAVGVSIGAPTSSSPTVPVGFVGFSIEVFALPRLTGSGPGAVNPVLEQLIRNLVPSGRPVLRIGGDSTDQSWWPVPGMPRPPGVGYTITPAWIAATRRLARDIRARVIAGVNLEADSRRVARAEAQALISGLGPWLSALELGNEPDNYTRFPYFHVARVQHRARAVGYGPRSLALDYARISPALPPVPLAGPALGTTMWSPALAGFLRTHPRVRIATVHAYPLNRCFTRPSQPIYPTVGHLLSAPATSGLAQGLAPDVAAARAAGVPLRVDELGSVACGGEHGLSDTFASALWASDVLFEMLQAGVSGVNFHTFPGAAYEPFSFTRRHGHWSAKVKPEYLGLLMFTRAAPAGSRLLPIRMSNSGRLHAWATLASDGLTRVLLINDSLTHSATVSLSGTGIGPADLERLSAPSIHARTGVRLAGQSFASPTRTGRLSGALQSARLLPTDQRLIVRLAPASEALVTTAGGLGG